MEALEHFRERKDRWEFYHAFSSPFLERLEAEIEEGILSP